MVTMGSAPIRPWGRASPRLGVFIVCEDQDEGIDYSVYLEINFYGSILSLVQSLDNPNRGDREVF